MTAQRPQDRSESLYDRTAIRLRLLALLVITLLIVALFVYAATGIQAQP